MKSFNATVVAVAVLALSHPAHAFLDEVVKSAAESMAKGAVESATKGMIKTSAAGTSTAPAGADCKRGQLVNPYFIMLQANQLPDGDLADQACVSGSQLKKLTETYIKLAIIR